MDPIERTELASAYLDAINEVAKEVVSMAGRIAQQRGLDAQKVLEGVGVRMDYVQDLDEATSYLDACNDVVKEAFRKAASIGQKRDLDLAQIIEGIGTHVFYASQTPRMYADDDAQYEHLPGSS